MYFLDNPILQRELVVNLRMVRGFLLLFVYVGLLGAVVWLAWPKVEKLDMTNSYAARRLVDMFFLGQFVIASSMAPSFAAGAITGDKERKTYEMLLASPMRPGAIVLGKLLASLCHVSILIACSLPIVMLCLPLGGVSFFEVLAAYLGLLFAVITFGMISIACSSYFVRTSASLVVSYLIILPLALLGVFFWQATGGSGAQFRLYAIATLGPGICLGISVPLFLTTARRLLYPPDVGSEGKSVVDEVQESRQAMGMVIQRDQFPDRLFAPPKRTELLPDHVNPVYYKEIGSELFSQGTLMLRLVIQIGMLLALPLMAFCLYLYPWYAPWYLSYTVLFSMLVGPVFAAGSVTGERERETLDLLLVTILSPWKIMAGKLRASLRVSIVLTSFLLWPVALSCLMVKQYWQNLPTFAAYLAVVLLACTTCTELALLCSVLFRKTTTAMMSAYVAIVFLFGMPLAAGRFAEMFLPETDAAYWAGRIGFASPFAAVFALPLSIELADVQARVGDLDLFWRHIGFGVGTNLVMAAVIVWLFRLRWRVAS